MSSGKRSNRARDQGWEEAGGEFYQESYPGSNPDQEFLESIRRTSTDRLATLLPSKQGRNPTVKRRKSEAERRASTANNTATPDVHLAMLPDLSAEDLSNEERTWEEIMQIKAMPLPMAQKRELKIQLQNATKLRLQGFEELQWKQRKAIHRFNRSLKEFFSKLILWRLSLKKIEGNFGTGVASYFLFLRWLLFLNFSVSLLIITFLIIPKALFAEMQSECLSTSNSSVCCHEIYSQTNVYSNNVYLDLIQGTGWMERTIIYYGIYPKGILNFFIGDKTFYYNMSLAYILVAIAWFILSLVAILKSASKGFKEKLVEREGQFYKYCSVVFCGWDFCIHNEKSANIKHKALFNELKGSLEKEKWSEVKHSRSKQEQVWLFFKRFFINCIVFIILVLSVVLIYYVFNISMKKLGLIVDDTSTSYRSNETASAYTNTTIQNQPSIFGIKFDTEEIYQLLESNIVYEFLPAMTIVLLNMIVPEFFAVLVKYENYMPAVVLKVTLMRTIFLRLSSLSVLISQIYLRITDPNRNTCPDDPTNVINSCWETYVGQQLYKLILTNFFIQLLMTFFVNFPRSLLAKHTNNACFKRIGTLEFYLPQHVLDIVYSQTIIWIGTFYCPFLPLIGTIFYFLIFYIKKFACLVNCTPSANIYNASESKSLFMLFLLISFALSISPVAYSLSEIMPSISCGPFRDLSSVWSQIVMTYDSFPGILRSFFYSLSTANFAVPVFAILICLLYYYWAVAEANRLMVNALKSQLVLEGHDKQFLLNRLTALIRHRRQLTTTTLNSEGTQE